MKTFFFLLSFVLCFTGCSKSSDSPTPVKAPTPIAMAAPVKQPPHTPTVTAYNGLLYAEMGPLVTTLEKRGDKVSLLWHDAQSTDQSCPEYIIGHSMGGNAAIRQAIKCQSAGKPPKAIIIIDAGRAPLAYQIPANAKFTCQSFYDPAHPIGGQVIDPEGTGFGQCHNTVVPGYTHLQMPSAPGIVKAVLNTIPAATK